LVVRFLTHRFIGDYDPNLESVYTHQTRVDDQTVYITILDTAGDLDENNPLRLEQFKTSDAFLYVFSVTDRKSFDYLKTRVTCHSSVKREGEKSPPILLIGNKKDLCHLRAVSTKEGETFATEIGALYMELSASENVRDIEDAFHCLYREYNRAEKREKVKRLSARLQLRQTIKNFTDKHLYHRSRTHTL
ncbi:putative GTP-binding protein Rit1-like, partial [Apostichopus japonicus]